MRILITGSNGFLGQKLIEKLKNRSDVTLLGISKSENRNPHLQEKNFLQIDITNFNILLETLGSFKPTHIVHTAAITSVEACEADAKNCENLNVFTTKHIAEFCEKSGCHLTFLSTDFVFDGKGGPYREEDRTTPCNAYGHSKLEAERIIMEVSCQFAILRTILVYGVIADKNRSNLVLWAKNKLQATEPISVVEDQWRMATWVDDLADACILAMEKKGQGIFHISGEKLLSILEIVQEVAKYWKLNPKLITPISANAIGQATNRPRKTGFILSRAKDRLGFEPTDLTESFAIMEQQLKKLNIDG